MLEKRYSGDLSESFWEVVHLVDDENHTIYELGCQLQNLEERVFTVIEQRCQLIERLKTAYNKRIKRGSKLPHAKRTS